MTQEFGHNADREIAFLADEIVSLTVAIEPLNTRLEEAKRAIRAHAPCHAAVEGAGISGTVTVAAPPKPAAPRTVYTVAEGLAPEIVEDLVAKGVIVATTPKPKKQSAAVSVTVRTPGPLLPVEV